jgi:hypothetical protein
VCCAQQSTLGGRLLVSIAVAPISHNANLPHYLNCSQAEQDAAVSYTFKMFSVPTTSTELLAMLGQT